MKLSLIRWWVRAVNSPRLKPIRAAVSQHFSEFEERDYSGEWEPDPHILRRHTSQMRRRRKDGTYDFRPMTDDEIEDMYSREAW